MSFVSEKERKLILDLLLKRINEEQFFKEFPATRENISRYALGMLQKALVEKDSDGVEFGISLMYHFKFDNEFLGVLNSLANESWHRNHEDVVFALGKLKDPSSVDVLSKTAVVAHPYLDVDEAFALGTKSIYALKAIQTPEAIEKLAELAQNKNEILKSTAIGRLKDIANKGNSEPARVAAKAILDRMA